MVARDDDIDAGWETDTQDTPPNSRGEPRLREILRDLKKVSVDFVDLALRLNKRVNP